jgi:hypothetical protein
VFLRVIGVKNIGNEGQKRYIYRFISEIPQSSSIQCPKTSFMTWLQFLFGSVLQEVFFCSGFSGTGTAQSSDCFRGKIIDADIFVWHFFDIITLFYCNSNTVVCLSWPSSLITIL